MQTVSTAFTNAVQKAVTNTATVRLIAEWNMNRYAGIASVTNKTSGGDDVDEYDEDLFPLDSIAYPVRPKRGLLVARVTKRQAGTKPEAYVTPGYSDVPTNKESYLASSESKYKYYTSPNRSASTTGTPGKYSLSNTNPTIMYKTFQWVNKIVVGMENTIASPVDFKVQVTTDGTSWTTIATNPAIDGNGRVILYRQADGSWKNIVNYNNPQKTIKGIRLSVTSMNAANVFFNLIELSPRFEQDLSYFVEDWDHTQTMSEQSWTTPLGTCSSNTASVTLNNVDGRFNNTAPAPYDVYNGIIDKNIEFRLDVGLDTSKYGGNAVEYVREFTMHVDSWTGQGDVNIKVNLVDSSQYLQSVKPAQTLFQNMTVGEIVWRLCDAVGFNNYKYETADDDASTLVPYFWTDGESTVWDYFGQLAQSTQTAIYFDENDVLQIKTRNAAYKSLAAAGISYTFDDDNVAVADNGRPASEVGKLADIIDLSSDWDYEANQVNVTYKPTAVSSITAQGVPTMETVWEPEGTVALRSSNLRASISSTDDSLLLDRNDVITWPYNGVVQVEGEFIRYNAKNYIYYGSDGKLHSNYVETADEKAKYDKLNPANAYKNYFTGRLGYLDRGLWASVPASHKVDVSGWTYNRYRTTPAAPKFWNGGFKWNNQVGTVSLKTNKTFKGNSWYVCTRGSRNDSPPYWYGTRMKFASSGYTYGAAGIVMSAGDNDSGFYIELMRTKAITAARRKNTNELSFYVIDAAGKLTRIGGTGGRGIAMAINDNTWYDLDVHFEWQGTNRIVSIMVNGVTRMTVTVPAGSGTGESIGGRYGMFTRGFTFAEFEYMYASTYSINESFDQEGFFDKVHGGYQSSQWDREWTYGWRTNTKIRHNKKFKIKSKYGSRLFDEFGPVVHEVREYSVNFSKVPVLHSRLYMSNDSQVICPEYLGTPFGASFVLANTSRVNAIVNGEDTLMFGSENPVTQKMLIYGRTITQSDDKKYTVKNADAIARRGLVEIDIDNRWLQTDAAAKATGEWILKHWAGGSDEVSVQINAVPQLQLGDIVAINYRPSRMTRATHRYFVVGISSTFDGGLAQTLTLRRAKV